MKELLSSFTSATRYRLLRLVPKTIEWADADTVTIEELSIEDAEAGNKPGFVCPHCEKTFRADRLNYVDVAVVQEEFNRVDFERQTAYIDDINDVDDITFEHAALICPECFEPVALPPRWDHGHE